jgi:hypothetical protein
MNNFNQSYYFLSLIIVIILSILIYKKIKNRSKKEISINKPKKTNTKRLENKKRKKVSVNSSLNTFDIIYKEITEDIIKGKKIIGKTPVAFKKGKVRFGNDERSESKKNFELCFDYFTKNKIVELEYDKIFWWELIEKLTDGKTKTIDYVYYTDFLQEMLNRYNLKQDVINENDPKIDFKSINDNDSNTEKRVMIGSKVTIFYLNNNQFLDVTISDTKEKDRLILFYNEGLGKLLLDRTIGEIIEFKTDKNNITKIEVKKIDNSNVINFQNTNPPPKTVSPIKLPQSDILPIFLNPKSPEDFKSKLIEEKNATIEIHYNDGTFEEKNWKADNIKSNSNIIGNLRSRYEFRNGNWQKSNIKYIKVYIS